MTVTQQRRGVLAMLAAGLVWPAVEFTGVSMMGRHHALQVVFFRYFVHLVLLLALLLPLRGLEALKTRRPVLQLLRGVSMFGMPACYVFAADYASSRWIWSVFWTMPLLALIGAFVMLRERPRRRDWLAVIIGAVGAAAIRGVAGADPIGTVFALGMAGTFAAYMVLSRMLRDEPLPASLFYTALGAIVPTAMVVWHVWTPVVPADIVPMLVVGGFSIVALALFDVALEQAITAAVVPLLLIVPVYETAITIPLRGVFPTPLQLGGVALALISTGLVLARRHPVPRATERRTDQPNVRHGATMTVRSGGGVS